MPKPLTVWITTNRKILKEMGIPDHLTCLLRNLYACQEATVRTGHGITAGSKLVKEYIKAVYCHPAYLIYMLSTSWEMLGWRKHKLESRLLGEISRTSGVQMTPPEWTEVNWIGREGDKEWRCWRPCRSPSASGKDERGTEGIFRVGNHADAKTWSSLGHLREIVNISTCQWR